MRQGSNACFSALVVALAGSISNAQTVGIQPEISLNPVDIFTQFQLPPYGDSPQTRVGDLAATLRVARRARFLGLTEQSAIAAWNGAGMLSIAPSDDVASKSSSPVLDFTGSTASALNQVIAQTGVSAIRIVSQSLMIDTPIRIQRSGITLNLGHTELIGANAQPYMLRVENVSTVTVTGGRFESGDSAILVSASYGVVIDDAAITGLRGAGIIVTDSIHVAVQNNHVSGAGLCGIMIHRGTSQAVVRNNTVSAGKGFSNMMAGIVVTDREVDLTANPRAILGPDGYGVVQQDITQLIHPPRDILLLANRVIDGVSSGIYLDGPVRTVVYANIIQGNAKEGLCLDNGATAVVVASNTVMNNGQRWGQPDAILALDFVLDGGRLPDGTAAEKLPGVSIDNGIYNIVFENNVAHNYGGGVKLVRTAYFNAVGLNTIYSDNDGASDNFHFFGIELGAAPGNDPTLDFTPSRGNVIFCNALRGSHYSGIFFGTDSDGNNVMDNTILDAIAWGIESVKPMPNNSVNNLTNLPSRNIGSGLESNLIMIGQPVYDPLM